MDENDVKELDKYWTRVSQGACMVSSMEFIAELCKVFDNISVQKDTYGDLTNESRVTIWRVELLISEAARVKE